MLQAAAQSAIAPIKACGLNLMKVPRVSAMEQAESCVDGSGTARMPAEIQPVRMAC
jgi:hypothetical protein